MPSIAERLKKLFREQDLSQRRVADLVSVSRGTVAGWLSGAKPYPSTVGRLARVLGVSAEWLLSGTGAKQPRPEHRRAERYDLYASRLPTMSPEERDLYMEIGRDLLRNLEGGFEEIISEYK